MIVIEMEKADIEYAYKIQEICKEESTGVILRKSFSGISEVAHIGIELSEVILPFVAGIIIEMIRSNKKVRIRIGEREKEVENISEKNALRILKQLLEEQNETPPVNRKNNERKQRKNTK